MTSILISLLVLSLTLYAPIKAQPDPPTCPYGSSLKTSTTTFTVSTSPSELKPHLHFYSPTWHLLLHLNPELTFAPPTRTLSYAAPTLTLIETLLSLAIPSSGFDITWSLSSPFSPPGSPDTTITFYKHILQIRPLCPGDTYTLLTWSTHFCLTSTSSSTLWFENQHKGAAEYIFAKIATGSFDNDGFCPGETPVPTTTFFTTYPGVFGPGTTLAWPAGGRGSSVVRPVAVETGVEVEKGQGAVETYRAVSGGGWVVSWGWGWGVVGVVGVVLVL